MKYNLRDFSEISNDEEFWRGTLLRKVNVGMNKEIVNQSDDFYDYLLTHLPWESEFFILVNVTSNNSKKGAVYSGVVPLNSNTGNLTVTKKSFQHTLGKDLTDWYILE